MLQRSLRLLIIAVLPACGQNASTEAPPPPAPKQWTAADRTAKMAGVEAALQSLGYQTQRGQMEFFAIEDCRFLDNCYGNNPSSPYGLAFFPPLPGEDTSYTEASGDLTRPAELGTAQASMKFAASDVLIWLGRTPTPVRYFGLTPYLFQRKPPGAADWAVLFASLTDTLNTVVMEARLGGDPFNREVAVLIGRDADSLADARAQVTAAGLDYREVFTIVLPDLYRFGIDDRADVFLPLMRFAYFESPAAQEAYLAAPPFEVLRMRIDRGAAMHPAQTPPLRPYPDLDEDELAAALRALENAVAKTYGDRVSSTTPSLLLHLEGYDCIASLSPCLGDNRDTPYFANIGSLLLDDGGFSIAIGVNHKAYGTAAYSNVGFYNGNRLMGVAAIGDEGYAGSADRYLPDHPQRELLFAVHYARDCAGVPTPCVEVPTAFPGVPLDTRVSLAERAYIAPGYAVGPKGENLLPLKAIHIRP